MARKAKYEYCLQESNLWYTEKRINFVVVVVVVDVFHRKSRQRSEEKSLRTRAVQKGTTTSHYLVLALKKSKLENPLSFFKFVRVIMAAVSSFYTQTIYSVLVWMLFYTFGTNSFQALKQMMLQLDHERHLKLDAFERVEDLQRQVIGHFRVPNNLTFQTARLNAKPFVGKWVLFARKCKILFIAIASNSASFWNSGLGQLRMAYSFVN